MEPLNFSAWVAQQRMLEATDIVAGDDLVAIGKKINKKGRDGEQYKEFGMTIEEFAKSIVPVEPFTKLVMKFRENGGEPEAVFFENTTGYSPNFFRENTGKYVITVPKDVFIKDRFYVPGIVDGRASLIPISDTTDTIGYFYIRWKSTSEIHLFVMDKNYDLINLGSLIGNNWFNVPEIKTYKI